jgi:hypothetical protein
MTHWLLKEEDHAIKNNQVTSTQQIFIELCIWPKHFAREWPPE